MAFMKISVLAHAFVFLALGLGTVARLQAGTPLLIRNDKASELYVHFSFFREETLGRGPESHPLMPGDSFAIELPDLSGGPQAVVFSFQDILNPSRGSILLFMAQWGWGQSGQYLGLAGLSVHGPQVKLKDNLEDGQWLLDFSGFADDLAGGGTFDFQFPLQTAPVPHSPVPTPISSRAYGFAPPVLASSTSVAEEASSSSSSSGTLSSPLLPLSSLSSLPAPSAASRQYKTARGRECEHRQEQRQRLHNHEMSLGLIQEAGARAALGPGPAEGDEADSGRPGKRNRVCPDLAEANLQTRVDHLLRSLFNQLAEDWARKPIQNHPDQDVAWPFPRGTEAWLVWARTEELKILFDGLLSLGHLASALGKPMPSLAALDLAGAAPPRSLEALNLEDPSRNASAGALWPDRPIYLSLHNTAAMLRKSAEALNACLARPAPPWAGGASALPRLPPFDGKALAESALASLERMEQTWDGQGDRTLYRIKGILTINRVAAFQLAQAITSHGLPLTHHLRAEAIFLPSLVYPDYHARFAEKLAKMLENLGPDPDLAAFVQDELPRMRARWEEIRDGFDGVADADLPVKTTSVARALLNHAMTWEILQAKWNQRRLGAWANDWVLAPFLASSQDPGTAER
jgi:hypothetical protein